MVVLEQVCSSSAVLNGIAINVGVRISTADAPKSIVRFLRDARWLAITSRASFGTSILD